MPARGLHPSSPRSLRLAAPPARAREAEAESVCLTVEELQLLVRDAALEGAERALARAQRGAEPVVALPTMKAAKALGVGHGTFKREIAPELECVRINRKPTYALAELQRWHAEHAEPTL
jgi:hypothetical protein